MMWICPGMCFVLCPKLGNKVKVAVLNYVYILGIFCLKQGQGQGQLNYTQILVEHPHPSPGFMQG